MALVCVENVGQEYSGRWVLRDVGFELAPGRKVGLIGPNGSGKTTLLRILAGQVRPGHGTVKCAGDTRIGYVPQRVEFATDETVRDMLLAEYRQVRDRLKTHEQAVEAAGDDEMAATLAAYQRVRDAYDRIGGDHFTARAEAMLDAIGLAGRAEQRVHELSGGEKNVLGMAQALLAEPNLLLLDEPGNHLDFLGLAWLEEFLSRFRGAVLIVSHNRYLLDKVAEEVLELDNGRLMQYTGNYTAYREQKAERLRAQQREYDAHQQRVAHLEALVQKFADIAQGHASDATWGKRLRARRSQLERLKAQAVDRPQGEGPAVHANFGQERTRADIALQLRGYRKAYGERILLDGVEWDVGGGQRWALVGPNGCGKTSLLRDIISHGDWGHKTVRIGPSLRVGYCAQEQEVLDGDRSVYEELLAVAGATQEKVLAILARFLFQDEAVHKKIRYLSGGERNRLQLAKLMLEQPNFLVLDEPTNHLDIATREAVEEALTEFRGTLLVVSHDRYFLDNVVDHVAEVREHGLRLYTGNFSQFWSARQGEITTQAKGRVSQRARERAGAKAQKEKKGGQAWQERKQQGAEVRKARKQADELHERVETLEAKKQEFHDAMADAYGQGDNARGDDLTARHREVSSELELLYEEWLAAEEQAQELAEEFEAGQGE